MNNLVKVSFVIHNDRHLDRNDFMERIAIPAEVQFLRGRIREPQQSRFHIVLEGPMRYVEPFVTYIFVSQIILGSVESIHRDFINDYSHAEDAVLFSGEESGPEEEEEEEEEDTRSDDDSEPECSR